MAEPTLEQQIEAVRWALANTPRWYMLHIEHQDALRAVLRRLEAALSQPAG